MNNIAVILAGGVGSRVGADRPKQFIEILGKPILAYTIEAFQNHPEIDAIEIVCIENYIDYLKDMIVEYSFDKVKWITPGGSSFSESVMKGMRNLEGKVDDNDNLLFHFGASPFITEDIISDNIRVCNEKGNAISTTPFIYLSGYKDEDGQSSSKYIDRDTIACMNTPHAFKFNVIRDIYDRAISTGVIDQVEPHTTTIMYKLGVPMYFSKGSQSNIKITTKDDLDLFEGYVLMKERRKKNNNKLK